jgi:hypothetical protein
LRKEDDWGYRRVVQLAGCLTAAEGHDDDLNPGGYGYSLAYEKVALLRKAFDLLADGLEPQQVLAQQARDTPVKGEHHSAHLMELELRTGRGRPTSTGGLEAAVLSRPDGGVATEDTGDGGRLPPWPAGPPVPPESVEVLVALAGASFREATGAFREGVGETGVLSESGGPLLELSCGWPFRTTTPKWNRRSVEMTAIQLEPVIAFLDDQSNAKDLTKHWSRGFLPGASPEVLLECLKELFAEHQSFVKIIQSLVYER